MTCGRLFFYLFLIHLMRLLIPPNCWTLIKWTISQSALRELALKLRITFSPYADKVARSFKHLSEAVIKLCSKSRGHIHCFVILRRPLSPGGCSPQPCHSKYPGLASGGFQAGRSQQRELPG